MKNRFTSIPLSLVLGLSACSRMQTSPESGHRVIAESKTPPAPCGKILPLDDAAIKRLDLETRLTQAVNDAGFSDEELREMNSSRPLLKQQAFETYRSAYSTWYKKADDFQATLQYAVKGTIESEKYKKLPSYRQAVQDAYLVKFEKMMAKTHDLGKNDGTSAPCPF